MPAPSSYPLRVGVLILPESRWAEARSVWRRAETMGFAHAWTYDHITWRGHRDKPWFGAVPTLTAAAGVTEHIRLGTLVASPNFRHPVPFAKELVTLDDISGGRLTLGIGSGGTGWDAAMLGQPAWTPPERAGRFAEFVELTDLLLRQPAVTWRGRFYAAHEARNHPGCVQRPRIPLAVAAGGRRAMRVAARHGDTWVTTGRRGRLGSVPVEEGVDDVRSQIGLLDRACAEVGRDPRSIGRLVLTGPVLEGALDSAERFADAAERYAAIGVTDLVVHWPRPIAPFAADIEVFERIFGG